MTEPVVISVRGSAQTTVAPDVALLSATVNTAGPTKSEALAAASRGIDAAGSALTALGAAVKPADGTRLPIAYLVGVTSTQVETQWDERTHQELETGRVLAATRLAVEVRDFDRLDDVTDALTTIDDLHVGAVGWTVDHDNPVHARMRAEAVAQAIARARDYATALGGTLVRVDQLADTGLLRQHGDWTEQSGEATAFGRRVKKSSARYAPHLDPAPQTVSASVDARFAATVAAL